MRDHDADMLHRSLLANLGVIHDALPENTIEHLDGFSLVLTPSMPIPDLNGIVASEDVSSAIAAIEPARERCRTLGLPFGVTTVDGGAPRVVAAALAAGLTHEEWSTGMIVTREGFKDPGSRVEITHIEDVSGLKTWVDVAAGGFASPVELFESMVRPELLSIEHFAAFLAWGEGYEPIGTATTLFGGDGAGIANIATLPTHRGRGVGTALTAFAVRWGFERGASFAWLQAFDEGLSVYRRLGFREVSRYVCRSEPEGTVSSPPLSTHAGEGEEGGRAPAFDHG